MAKTEDRLMFPTVIGKDDQGREIWFSAYVDMIRLRQVGLRASRNKTGKAKSGPVRVVIGKAGQMSHSSGEIWLPDGSQQLGWFEYNGTSDVACARVYKTAEEMHIHWRGDHWRNCEDEAKHRAAWLPVVLYTSYGAGFWWEATICRPCQAITTNHVPTGDVSGESICHDGHPFFDQWMKRALGKILPCPNCGGPLRTRQDGDKHHCPICCEWCKKGFYEWQLEKQLK